MASMGDCIRELKEWDFKSTFEGQLPRGPVPPSGPSPCHNKLSPYNQSEYSLPNDYQEALKGLGVVEMGASHLSPICYMKQAQAATLSHWLLSPIMRLPQ
ncbi:hypothetical protein CFP56_009428 [Quercus suber]|uniref:Uncharacterized protein n=1 Tax=Quercus suber TaxID=58331 RepID=A0AAW0L2A5_QUESU